VRAGFVLAERVPNVHCVVVGAPPPDAADLAFVADLEACVRASPYADRFHFVGFRTDVAAVMKAIDILSIPSWREPFGRVAVEGMAAGCPVIASGVGGLPEIIRDGVDGLLVPPQNAPALAEAMVQLATHAELRRRLSSAGVASARRFSTLAHVQAVQAVYDSVLTGR
jgi:glycosyltransferase involved in cell wall biosynthesis